MTESRSTIRSLIMGAGGALLIASLFLPWAGAGEAERSGWELWTMGDVYLAIVGATALLAAVTGGHYGVFRDDVSLIGTTDLFGVVATTLLAWLLLFDFPTGSDPKVGVFLALGAAMAVAGSAGEYRRPRDGWVPRVGPQRSEG